MNAPESGSEPSLDANYSNNTLLSEAGDIEQVLLQAVTFHQAGQFDDAARIYRDILLKLPLQPNANHNLGVIALEAKDIDASLDLFKTALEAAPDKPQYWTSYIDALLQANQIDYAGQVLAHGVEGGLEGAEVESLKRRLADALLISQADNQSLPSAVSSLHAEAALYDVPPVNEKLDIATGKAIAKVQKNSKPNASEMNALASLFNQGLLVESEPLAIRMTQRYPRHGLGWKVLGAIRQQQGRVDEALSALKVAVALMPIDTEVHYNLGNCFYDLKQLPEAADSYRNAIKLKPTFTQAHYNLGSVLKEQGLIEQAEASYQKALKIDPKNVAMHLNLAQMNYEFRRFPEAIASYKAVIKLQANDAGAYMVLGVIYKELGQLIDAEAYYRKSLDIEPQYAEAYSNLGILLKESGRFDEAEQAYRTSIKIKPDCAPAYNNLGMLLRTMGDLPKAEQSYRQALLIDPANAVSHNNLGVALRDQGRFLESEVSCNTSIEIRPDYADPYNNLGLALDSQGRIDEAIAAFEQAIACKPNDPCILSNFSVTLITKGQLDKAEACLVKALEISPLFINLYINLCVTYLAQGRPQEAEVVCLKALEIQPDCISAKGNLLFAMNYSANHSVDECFAQARQYNAMVNKTVEHVFTTWVTNNSAKHLRVGIVSADMRQHAVSYFLENVVKHINANTIELIAYSADGREDVVTSRLKQHFSEWKSLVGLDDQAAAKLIHDDGVHVLIDLSGHSSGNRLPVFARKPAPVQVSWLGYFATTGLDAMDYFIADEIGVPKHSRDQFVEKIQYLPSTRLCFSVPDVNVPVSELPALRNGYITFGCFQNIAKVGDDVLSLWAKVIKITPNARLRLQSKALGDSVVAKSILERITSLGIDPGRVSMHGFDTREGYFVAHAEVDMILDTFPFNGGTTTCEALWMGVPTLTFAGNRLIARQGASLLSAAGLADWVVESSDDFVDKGVKFASDISKLAKLRAGLREQVSASPLFDGQLFARNMEKALWQMSGLTSPKLIDRQQMNQTESISNQELAQKSDVKIMTSDLNCQLIIVSATRSTEQDFWSQSALGVSLKTHMALDRRLKASIAFENTRGLSEVFNESIEQADASEILVFIHDDVWIDEESFADAVISGLKSFDVIGVAGNKRRVANQPSWAFIDRQFTWDDSVNLSGRVAHGKDAFGHVNDYGAVPAECELMDGVFFATKKSTLLNSNVKFDPQFDFHFYDLDFCRSARQAGLTLGTWLVNLTHQSGGAFGSFGWQQKYQAYLNKWDNQMTEAKKIPTTEAIAQIDQELQIATDEVIRMALVHQDEGRLEQAEQLYLEILSMQPNHIVANHNLGMIEAKLRGAQVALPRLKKALLAQPEIEQLWISYIKELMQASTIEVVLEALELGQEYGLSAEVAQNLAAEYVVEFELNKAHAVKIADEKVKKQPSVNVLASLGPLCHEYSFFGVNNEQLPGLYALNQKAKAPIITAYIAYAIAKSKQGALDKVSFTELFCADGYYAMVASRLGCEKSTGIDSNKDKHTRQAMAIADLLGIDSIEFIEQEITPGCDFERADIVANVGGLCHVSEPEKILRLSYEKAIKYLIIQTVVSLATDDENYFVAPAPGWPWGSRYSKQSLDKLVRSICPKVIDYHFNELEGSDQLSDRGSVYYLIEK